MAGLLVLAVMGAYLIVSVLLVYGVVKVVRSKGINPWLPGIIVTLIMYLLVFWDHIPVLIKHHNLCMEQGGFWINKTPDQWFKENPDAIGKKWAKPGESLRTEEISGGTRDWKSEYLYEESCFDKRYAHAISKYEYRMIDARTGEVLVRMVDFERGGGNPMLRADSITDYKFWLGMGDNECNTRKRREFVRNVDEMHKKYYLIGEGKK